MEGKTDKRRRIKSCVLLNVHPTGTNPEYNDYLNQLQTALGEKGLEVQAFDLCEMDIRYCTGSWICGWTTPGRCTLNEEMEEILCAVISMGQGPSSVSPLIAGKSG